MEEVVSVKQLLEKYGPDAKFYILDVKQSLKLVEKLETKVDNLRTQYLRNYSEMSGRRNDNDQEEGKPSLSNSECPASASSTWEERDNLTTQSFIPEYSEMSGKGNDNDQEERKPSLNISSNCEYPASAGITWEERRRRFNLDEVPVCSMGDDDVFYTGDGTEGCPIEIV